MYVEKDEQERAWLIIILSQNGWMNGWLEIENGREERERKREREKESY